MVNLEIIKRKAKIYRFPRLKDHIEEFIAFDLKETIENLYLDYDSRDIKIFYVLMGSSDFINGIDFYISINGKLIPIQITDSMESFKIFGKKGIKVIFLSEKRKNGEPFCPRERRALIESQLRKIIARDKYFILRKI